MVRLKIWQNESLFLRVIIIIINFSIRKAFSFIFSKIGDYIYFNAFQLIVSFIFLRHWINFLYSLMYSFFFLFVFFRNILFVYFFILFNFLSFFLDIFWYKFLLYFRYLHRSRDIFCSLPLFSSNTFYLFLGTFLYFFTVCVLKRSHNLRLLFDIAIINNSFYNHSCPFFTLRSAFFILSTASLLVVNQKWI